MGTARATLKSGRTVEFNTDMIGDGAMKEVYFTTDRQAVVCFYKDVALATDPVRLKRLEMILGKNNPTLVRERGGAGSSEAEAGYFRDLFCWPTDVVLQPRFGVMAPVYPGNFFFHTGPDFIKGKEKNGMRFIGGRNRALLEKFAPEELGEWRNYLALCIRMARAVARLHNAGLAHSDLSPNNVLVDPTCGKSIVIDIDSLVVEGLYPPDVLGTKGYIAPEVLSTMHLPLRDPQRKFPSARTDQHALPVLIYQYLLRRHPLDGQRVPPVASAEEQELLAYGSQAIFCEHPTDASNRPEEKKYVPCSALGPFLSDLFLRAFVKGLHTPNERPSALEWLRGLIKTVDLLLPCANGKCAHRWFVLTNSNELRCPFCKHLVKGSVPLLNLRTERRPGQWMPDGRLVLYDKSYLQRWHTFSGVFPGPETDRAPHAYCLYHDRRWLLVNQALASMTSVETGNRVAPGSAIELKHGARIRFANEPNGRIAEVQLLGS